MDDTVYNEEKRCKKCGIELPSDSKYDVCSDCRRKKAGRIRGFFIALATFAGAALTAKSLNGNVQSHTEDDTDEDDGSLT